MRWLIIFSLFSSTAFGQLRLEGTVLDKETGKPIPFASLVVVGTPNGTSSNQNGQFSIVVSEPFSIRVTCVGYETLVLNTQDELKSIELKPIAIQLKEVYVLNKKINPKKIVRKAFALIHDNYNDKGFLQKFFYRHYSKSDSVYERLIEASVDVWKHNGYKYVRKSAGDKEEMRVTQLRRSLDITGMVQAQKPLYIGYILQSDIAAYQTASKNIHLNFLDEVNNLNTDFATYRFSFDGITNYDGQEVYKIDYTHNKDSVLTTSGYKILPQASGSLFITTDTYAFIKTEDVKFDEVNTVRSYAYYRKYGNKYYPYHLIRTGENNYLAKKPSSFHVELMSVEIRNDEKEQFRGREPGRNELLNIPFDSSFWSTASVLKTTPLEDNIIRSLGGGISLNKQFFLYRQYELNVTDGGNNGLEKFNWLQEDSKGKRALYICFWDGRIKSYLIEVEHIKQLNLLYKNHVAFVMISLEDDEIKWQQMLTYHNFFADGIINYRVGQDSELTKKFKVEGTPAYIFINKKGEVSLDTRHPKDPLLEVDFKFLIERGQ